MKLILIVEDEYGNAEVLQMLLEAEGYRVSAASNGEKALESMEREVPDLILSDFMMPVMNGGELGKAVRESATLKDVPFVFMSATSEQVVQQTFRDHDGFLAKPYELETLLAMVARLLTSGRVASPSSEEVGESMRQLLKGIELPPES